MVINKLRIINAPMIKPEKCPGVTRRRVLHCTELFPSLYNLSYLFTKRHLVVNVLILVATFHADKCKCKYHKPYFLNCVLKTMNQGKPIKLQLYHNIKGYFTSCRSCYFS